MTEVMAFKKIMLKHVAVLWFFFLFFFFILKVADIVIK